MKEDMDTPSFESLLIEIDEIIAHLNQEGSTLFAQSRYDEAKLLLGKVKSVSDIQKKIETIKDEWKSLGLSQLNKSNSIISGVTDKEKYIDKIREKEIEILKHLQAGLSNEKISQKLKIGTGTTRNYISKIYSILEVSNRTEAVKKAVSIGILPPIIPDQNEINKIIRQNPTEAIISHFDLTHRELQILRLVENGKTNKMISEELELNEGTVRNYISSCFQKLGVGNRNEAVQKAKQYGLINVET
jgi:DNA-binding NarL/FixJ family response regulator